MKTILKSALLATALSGTSLMAGVVFDLGNQQFYYPAHKPTDSSGNPYDVYKEASYDVGSVIVSTGLTATSGYYRADANKEGHFGVRVKDPKDNWAINLGMYAYLADTGFSIQLLGEDGDTIGVSFEFDKVAVDGTVTISDNFRYGTTIAVSIQTVGNQVKVLVNNTYTYLLDKPNFRLAKFDVSLSTDNSNYTTQADKLYSLTISTSD